jgi:DNA-binding winged helix-turn-helix (wHTH) protein
MRFSFGEFQFDSGLRHLTRGDAIVGLTPKAALLLQTLVAAAPEPVSRESLYETLWHGVAVEQGNLHNLISELRSAIGDDDHAIISTVHRQGYAFTAPVTRDAGARLEVGSETLALDHGENTIGRDLLGTPDVSRHHARIDIDGARIWIEDLGSKNGTFVNGERIRERVALKEGDQIVFGRTRAIVRMVDAASPTITLTGNRE